MRDIRQSNKHSFVNDLLEHINSNKVDKCKNGYFTSRLKLYKDKTYVMGVEMVNEINKEDSKLLFNVAKERNEYLYSDSETKAIEDFYK